MISISGIICYNRFDIKNISVNLDVLVKEHFAQINKYARKGL